MTSDPQLTLPNGMKYPANIFPSNDARDATNLVAQPSLASGAEHHQPEAGDPQAAQLPAQVDDTRKRQRASEPDETVLPTPKKRKTADGSSQPVVVSKKAPKPRKARALGSKPKPKRYTELEEAIASPAPDYSGVTLSYSTRDEAASDFQTRLKELATYWTPPKNDPTIPQSNNDRRYVVRQLLGAMKDTSVAKDKFDSRWTPDAPRKHDDRDLEAACWEVAVSN
jgi:hypothetical protein